MSLPSPRTPSHDRMDDDPRREAWLTACAQLWDNARAQSRAQMSHGATMITQRFGGMLLIRAESTVTGRRVPEVGYMSECFSITETGNLLG